MRFLRNINFRVFRFLIFVVLSLGLFLTYKHYLFTLKSSNYRIFNFKKNISWDESEMGIVRLNSRGMVDNILISHDAWGDFDMSFDLVNPRTLSLVFNYQDANNFDFIFLNGQDNMVLAGKNRPGAEKDIVKTFYWKYQIQQTCHLKRRGAEVEWAMNGRPLFKTSLHAGAGKIGFILNYAFDPQTIIHDLKIKGTLANGRRIEAQSPARFSPIPFKIFIHVFLLCGFMLGLAFLLAHMMQWHKYRQENLYHREPFPGFLSFNIFAVIGLHLFVTVLLFWPFITHGHVLVSSYDNLGEIYPLFFFSKQNFWHFLKHYEFILWNPFSHNGVPFYNSHWNMIYYPLNWLVFLFSDQTLLWGLTLKTFLEVFFIGVLAYGFFLREFGDSRWALFCSIVYQLCSLLIFSLTIFPTISLYFSMTLYLYVLWSARSRSTSRNYLFLTLALGLVLTSANVAFVFYACLSLGVVTVYRLLSSGTEKKRLTLVVFMSSVTALLICSIRLLPCFWGILSSNRIVDGYYTLHDRFFLILRLFIPEIAGRLGLESLNMLTADNLHLVFKDIGLPANSQNTFFVYFGIISGILVAASLFLRARGPFLFWKIYALAALAISLLWQPLWGILSIVFFPLNHYSYHIIILPVGLCCLCGWVGLNLERKNTEIKSLARHAIGLLIFFQFYVLVFLTYSFPRLTQIARGIFIFSAVLVSLYFYLRKYSPHYVKGYGRILLHGYLLMTWLGIFIVGTYVVLRPLPKKVFLAENFILPLFAFLLIGLTALVIFIDRLSSRSSRKWMAAALVILVLIPGLQTFVLSSPWFLDCIRWDQAKAEFAADILLGHLRFYLIIPVFFLGIILMRVRFLSKALVTGFFILISTLDLLAFNFRFDNIAAPHYHNEGPFYNAIFPYTGFDPVLRQKLDLVNYRVRSRGSMSLNGNRYLLFGVPTYAGIMGYMPRRFHNLLVHLGYPKDTILIYPEDDVPRERLLELSASRYTLVDEENFKENPDVLARLNFFTNYEVIKEDEALLALLTLDAFDPGQQVLLSSEPGVIFKRKEQRAKVIPLRESGYNHARAQLDTLDGGIVLFNESYDEGWKVFINGQPVPLLIANYNFMACAIPAGKHEILFKYQPRKFEISRTLSLAGLALFVFMAAGLSVWPKKQRTFLINREGGGHGHAGKA